MNVVSAFSSVDFLPHGYCLQWNQWLIWLNAASDLLIAMSYFSIPLVLLLFVEKRADFKYRRILILFAVFILLCGTTHLLGAVILWEPFYWVDTLVKMATAAVSIYTAIVLWPLLPELLAIPSRNELEEADKRHRELASLLQSVLNAIPSSVFWKDAESRYLGCNSKHAAHVGLASPEEIVGKTDYDFFPPALVEKYRADDLKTMQSGESTIGYEEPYVGPNGDARYASTSKVPLVGIGNTVMGTVGAYDDITDRKKGEIELQEAKRKIEESERYFRTLFNAINDVILIHEFPTGKFIDVNEAACGVMGYSREEFLEMTPIDIDDPKFTLEMTPLPEVAAGVQSGKSVIFKRRHIKKDGTKVLVELHARLFDYNGRNIVISIVRDIFERKQAEVKLWEMARFNSLLIEQSNIGIAVYDPQGQCVVANKAIADIVGASKEQILKQNFRKIASWQESGMLKAAEEALLQNASKHLVVHTVSTFGKEVWLESLFTPVNQESGRYLMLMTNDIGERLNNENALKQSQAVLNALFNAISESVFIMDTKGVVQAINKTGAARLGAVPADLIGNNIYSLIPPEVKTHRMELMTKCIMTGEPIRFEDKRGDIWFDQILYPVKDDSGSVLMIAVFAMDITDRVNAEETMKRTMAELGRVNAELRDFLFVSSHDLQEPLRKIGGYIALLKEHLGPAVDGATCDYLDRMLNASLRMHSLIVDLLELSRIITRARPFGKVDLGMILRQVIDDLEIQVKECNAVVNVSLEGSIEADATQIRQLFQNLLGNALKFRKKDVPPVIRVSSSPNAEPLDILGIHYAIGELVVIYVADNGIGFQGKYAEKIFGLFQRLHQRDQYGGTGVGLAICKKIVERHKGSIIAEGDPGEGALFTISLPIRQWSKGESMGEFMGGSD